MTSSVIVGLNAFLDSLNLPNEGLNVPRAVFTHCLGRMLKSIVSVPDLCLSIYFIGVILKSNCMYRKQLKLKRCISTY